MLSKLDDYPVHQTPDPIAHTIGDAGNRDAREGMADENDIIELLESDDAADVRDVRLQTHIGTGQVLTLAAARAGGCEHAVPLGFQQRPHVPPHPAAVPGAVDQDESVCRVVYGTWIRMSQI